MPGPGARAFHLPGEIEVPRAKVDEMVRVLVRERLLELYRSIG